METTPFKLGIEESSLSRSNRKDYKRFLSALERAQALDKQLSEISVDSEDQSSTLLTDNVLQQIEKHEKVTGIMNEYVAVEATRKEVATEFERLEIAEQAKEEVKNELIKLLTTEGLTQEQLEELKKKETQYTFKNTYGFNFFQKINNGIQKNDTFWRPIATGIFAQYLSIKERVVGQEQLYDVDAYGNTPFHYINAYSIEDQSMYLPLSNEADKEVVDGLIKAFYDGNIHDSLCSLEDKDLGARLRKHYELLKDAFQKNILDLILNSKSPQYIYEAFVRTDLLRSQIKGVSYIGSPLTQLLVLARMYDNGELIGVIEHLLYACVAHKHDDDTNSGNFMSHIELCFELMGKKYEDKQLRHEDFTAERLEALRQHLWDTLV